MTSDNDSMFGDDDDLDAPMRHQSNKKKKRHSRFSSYHQFNKPENDCMSLNAGRNNSDDDVGSTHGLYEGRKKKKSIRKVSLDEPKN